MQYSVEDISEGFQFINTIPSESEEIEFETSEDWETFMDQPLTLSRAALELDVTQKVLQGAYQRGDFGKADTFETASGWEGYLIPRWQYYAWFADYNQKKRDVIKRVAERKQQKRLRRIKREHRRKEKVYQRQVKSIARARKFKKKKVDHLYERQKEFARELQGYSRKLTNRLYKILRFAKSHSKVEVRVNALTMWSDEMGCSKEKWLDVVNTGVILNFIEVREKCFKRIGRCV